MPFSCSVMYLHAWGSAVLAQAQYPDLYNNGPRQWRPSDGHMTGCSTAQHQYCHETDNINIVTESRININIKNTILWDVTLCSLVEVYWSFKGMNCFHLQGSRETSQEQAAFRLCMLFAGLILWPWRWRQQIPPKVSKFLLDYTVSCPRRQYISSALWQPQILQCKKCHINSRLYIKDTFLCIK
jgi:hypothetical protein